ncbi:MAG: serine acetyltransferase [Nitrososphaerota archaeon]|nr:serine acetyltransferase [Nitrososphaerota archaeon]
MKADLIALNMNQKQRPNRFGDEVLIFQRLLRKTEYFQNCRKDPISKIYLYYLRYRLHRLSLTYGFTIPRNVFGPGLSIAHRGTIIIHPEVKVGENCRLSPCVIIGTSPTDNVDLVPKIGNNVFIGPGAVITGNIEIADGIAIGANSYVDRSFLEREITIAGSPARKISEKGQRKVFGRATDILRQKIELEH